MAKISLTNILSGFNLSKINDNFTKIANEFNSNVLYRTNPPGEPNQMSNDLDMNSNHIMNLPVPTSPTEAARLIDVQNAILNTPAANLVSFSPYKNITSINLQAAIQEEIDDLGGSNGGTLISWIQNLFGSVVRTIQDKFSENVSIKDFGGSPSIADNYAAALAAYNAVSVGGVIRIPSGTYNFLTPLVLGTKRVSWVGEGARQSVFNYTGLNTNTDCFTFGDGLTEVNGVRIKGLGFSSSTSMTGGAGVHFLKLSRARLEDVLFDHQDGNGNFNIGVWFDSLDFVTVDGYQARGKLECMRINGAISGPKADMFLSNGKVSSTVAGIGIHIAGAFGGFHIDSTDVIGSQTNIRISQDVVAQANRETFFGSGCFLDSAQNTPGNYQGINLDIQDTGGFVMLRNTWVASAGTLIRVGTSFAGNLQIDGGMLFNAFNTFGGNGNALEIGSTSAIVAVNGTEFNNVNGTAVICTAGVNNNISLKLPRFRSNVISKTSNIGQTNDPHPITGQVVINGPSMISTSVGGGPLSVWGGVTNGGTANLVHYGTTGNFWLELAKSNTSTLGTQGLVTAGQTLGGIAISGSDGTTFIGAARITAVASATPSAGNVPAELQFLTRVNSGSLTNRMTITSVGNVRPGVDNAQQCGETGLRWSSVWAANGTIQTSDIRTKKDIQTSILGLDFINRLHPVSYKWIEGSKKIIEQKYNEDGSPGEIITESVPGTRTHWGLIAQEVKQLTDEFNVDFAGHVISDMNDPTSIQAIRYDEFISPIIKAIQELTEKVKQLENK